MVFNFNSKVFSGKFENNIFTIIFGLLMGVTIIFFIIWLRLFKDKLPRQIGGDIYSLQFWVILGMFIYILLVLIYKINKIQKRFRGVKTKSLITLRF